MYETRPKLSIIRETLKRDRTNEHMLFSTMYLNLEFVNNWSKQQTKNMSALFLWDSQVTSLANYERSSNASEQQLTWRDATATLVLFFSSSAHIHKSGDDSSTRAFACLGKALWTQWLINDIFFFLPSLRKRENTFWPQWTAREDSLDCSCLETHASALSLLLTVTLETTVTLFPPFFESVLLLRKDFVFIWKTSVEANIKRNSTQVSQNNLGYDLAEHLMSLAVIAVIDLEIKVALVLTCLNCFSNYGLMIQIIVLLTFEDFFEALPAISVKNGHCYRRGMFLLAC